jgi:hypothetical protein
MFLLHNINFSVVLVLFSTCHYFINILCHRFHQVDSDDLTIAINFWWRSNTMSCMLEHMDAYYLRRILRRYWWWCSSLFNFVIEYYVINRLLNVIIFLFQLSFTCWSNGRIWRLIDKEMVCTYFVVILYWRKYYWTLHYYFFICLLMGLENGCSRKVIFYSLFLGTNWYFTFSLALVPA